MITRKEHKVIAHILKFVKYHYSMSGDLIKENKIILKSIDNLKNKLDDEYLKLKDSRIEDSPYYGWRDERGLSEFLLADMVPTVKESDKIAKPVLGGRIIPKKIPNTKREN